MSQRRHAARKPMNLRVWWVLLVFGAIALGPVRRKIDRPPRQTSETPDVLYIPSGDTFRRLSLGYEGLLADIYWTRAVQYYGRRRMAGAASFELLGPLLRGATILDPNLIIAYRFGAIFLADKPPEGAGQPQEALQLLRRGIVANPEYWRLWQDLGFIYYWDLRDYARAARAFRVGSERPGAQIWMKVLAAVVAAKGGEAQSSRLLWSEIYHHAENDSIRRSAVEHLAALKAQEDIQRLNQLLVRYQDEQGHAAHSFAELVAVGVVPAVPLDPSGVPYIVKRDPINKAGRADVAPNSRVNLQLLQ